jgi:hypothetical protein
MAPEAGPCPDVQRREKLSGSENGRYGSGTFTSNLWMLEGFAAKPGFFARFGR